VPLTYAIEIQGNDLIATLVKKWAGVAAGVIPPY
jgi:hypothetical protein